MAEFTVAQAALAIVPSFQGFSEAINSEAAKAGQSAGGIFSDSFNEKAKSGTSGALGNLDADAAEKGSSAGGKFADAFRAHIEAALRALPDVDIDANSSDADVKIAAIREALAGLSERVGIDLTDEEALDKLAVLKAVLEDVNHSSESIQVKVDTGEAIAQLTELDAVVAASDVEMDSLGGSAGGAGGGLSALGGDAGASIGPLGGLAAGIAALAVALIPIAGLAGGALAALPSLLAGAGAGIGALKLGLSGISGALSAYSTEQNKAATATAGAGASAASAASQAISNAATIRNAAASVASAEEAQANAQVTAANSVHSAQEQLASSEQSLAAAQQNEKDAQVALTQARVDAANQLKNYQDQLADGALQAQQDQLNLLQAQQQLVADQASGAPQLTISQDQLGVAQAQQAIQDQADQYAQLRRAAAAAAAAGVEGSTQVVGAQKQLDSATQSVTTAQQAQADAATALSQAQASAAQKIADANTAVTTALQNQSDALKQVALSANSAAGGGSAAATATNAFAAAMAKLTPSGREFVNFIIGLEGQLNALKAATQNALLPGLQAGLTAMEPLFEVIGGAIVIAAGGIGSFATQLGILLGSATSTQEFAQIFQQGAGFMQQMGQAVLDLIPAFLQIGSQAGPIVSALGGGVDHLAKAFANWVSNGGFQGFLTWLKENGPAIVGDVSSLFKGFGGLLVALAPVGVVLDGVVGFLGKFLEFLDQSPAAMAAAIVGLGTLGIAIAIALDTNPVGLIITAIGLLIAGIVELVTHWDQIWAEIKQVFDEAVQFLQSGFGTLVVLLTGPIAPLLLLALHWQQVWSALQTAAQAVWTFLDTNIFQPLVNFFTATVPNALDIFVGFFVALPGKVASALSGFISTAFSDLTTIGSWLETNVWTPISSFFSGLGARIATVAVDMWDGVGNAFISVLNDIINIWDKFRFPSVSLPFGLGTIGGFGLPHIDDVPLIGKASGGDVAANTSYLVGELGPEVLTLGNMGGYITPHHDLSHLAAAGGSSSAGDINFYDTTIGTQEAAQSLSSRLAFLQSSRRL